MLLVNDFIRVLSASTNETRHSVFVVESSMLFGTTQQPSFTQRLINVWLRKFDSRLRVTQFVAIIGHVKYFNAIAVSA